jgi:hypothetical protein
MLQTLVYTVFTQYLRDVYIMFTRYLHGLVDMVYMLFAHDLLLTENEFLLLFSGIALATYFLRIQIVVLMRGKRSSTLSNSHILEDILFSKQYIDVISATEELITSHYQHPITY